MVDDYVKEEAACYLGHALRENGLERSCLFEMMMKRRARGRLSKIHGWYQGGDRM